MSDTCPERKDNKGPDSHAVECIEQPMDVSAFFVIRCVECGTELYRCETEEAYLKEYGAYPDPTTKTEHNDDLGGLF